MLTTPTQKPTPAAQITIALQIICYVQLDQMKPSTV
jgi:hypothetical protein